MIAVHKQKPPFVAKPCTDILSSSSFSRAKLKENPEPRGTE